MLNAIKALFSIIDRVLALFQEEKLLEQGRREAILLHRLRAIEAEEKAHEVETQPAPVSKSDILDRM